MGFPTPDTLPATVKCRRLRIPDDPVFLAAVTGALYRLTEMTAWEQYGAVTPAQAAAAAFQMMLEYFEDGACTLIGSIFPYATALAPDGCLPCDGSTFNRVDHPQLYAVLDAAFILTADTFKTPDLRGRTVIGAGQGTGLTNRAVGAAGGAETHTLTLPQIPPHQHIIFTEGSTPATSPRISRTTANGNFAQYNTTAAGEGEAHNNMQPFLALKYCIVAR